MPRNIRYLPNHPKNFFLLRAKSVFLMVAQNQISVRPQRISKHSMNGSEIIIPKKLSSETITISFSFVSLFYWFYEK